MLWMNPALLSAPLPCFIHTVAACQHRMNMAQRASCMRMQRKRHTSCTHGLAHPNSHCIARAAMTHTPPWNMQDAYTSSTCDTRYNARLRTSVRTKRYYTPSRRALRLEADCCMHAKSQFTLCQTIARFRLASHRSNRQR